MVCAGSPEGGKDACFVSVTLHYHALLGPVPYHPWLQLPPSGGFIEDLISSQDLDHGPTLQMRKLRAHCCQGKE